MLTANLVVVKPISGQWLNFNDILRDFSSATSRLHTNSKNKVDHSSLSLLKESCKIERLDQVQSLTVDDVERPLQVYCSIL